MGLSKKLGSVSNQRNIPQDSMSVTYKWSHQSYTIQDILKKFRLPCVVQCATDQCSISWSKFQFDLRYPILLYSKRTINKVHARNLHGTTKEEFGPPVAIPEDYEGWFGASPKASNQTRRHTRIQSIANTNTLRFLICTKCPAFTRSTNPIDAGGGNGGVVGGGVEYVPRDIMPGEAFKRVCIMDGDLNDPDTPDIILQNGPCLECLDDKDDDVLIPLSRRAIAYEIAELYPDAPHKIFDLKSVMAAGNSKLPRIVSIVHGERPHLDYAYTGMLRCYSVFTEETILAASLDDPSSVCLELTTDSNAKFRLNLNEAFVKRTCEYNNAFQICKASGDVFLRGIKASFSLTTDASKIEDADLSMSENLSISDTQETDANSEFEINWSSEQNTLSSKSNFSTFLPEDKSTSNNTLDNNSKQRPRDENKTNGQKSVSEKATENNDTVSDLTNPFPGFSEEAIANLMVRKGMIKRLGACSSSDLDLTEEIETLRKSEVKVNPLFMFSESYAVEDKSDSELDNSPHSTKDTDHDDQSIDTTHKHGHAVVATDSKKREFYHLDDTEPSERVLCSELDDVAKSAEHVYDHNDDSALNFNTMDSDDTQDIVEISIDESNYSSAVYKQASEYREDDSDSDDNYDRINVGDNNNGVIDDTKNDALGTNSNSNTSAEECRSSLDSPAAYCNDDDDDTVEDITPEDLETKEYCNVNCKNTTMNSKSNTHDFGIVPMRTSFSADFPRSNNEVDYTPMAINGKRRSEQRLARGSEKSVLHKFKSESNISKLFDRIKVYDSDKSKSKMKFFQMKRSFPDKNKDTKPINVSEENFDEFGC